MKSIVLRNEKYCAEELTDSALCSLYPKELTLRIDGQSLDVINDLLKVDIKPLMDKNCYTTRTMEFVLGISL